MGKRDIDHAQRIVASRFSQSDEGTLVKRKGSKVFKPAKKLKRK